jgi:hypothetical protein
MTKGVLLFASNNSSINYVKQAHYLAKRISKYMGLPTSIVTSTDIESDYPEYVDTFDYILYSNIMHIDATRKRYADGSMYDTTMNFYNKNRARAYNLTPYDQTIVMDTDYIICNDKLNKCFVQQKDLLLYKDATHVGMHEYIPEFERVSDTSIDFYWATVFFFRKTKQTEAFFGLVKHIEENYMHYRNMYQFKTTVFRNDFAFSIAIHMMNGFQQGGFVSPLPGKLLYTTDKDILWNLEDDNMFFLVEKEKHLGEYTPMRTRGQSIHVMNKFSLVRQIDKEMSNG